MIELILIIAAIICIPLLFITKVGNYLLIFWAIVFFIGMFLYTLGNA